MSKVPSWARPAARPRTRTSADTNSRLRTLALEPLEARTLMAVLPPVTVNGQVDISGGTGNDNTPTVTIDPNDPQKLVAVWTRNDPGRAINNGQTAVFVEGAYTVNGGQNWSTLSGLNNLQTDFGRNQTNGPFYFPRVTDASVAFGPGDQFYVSSMFHDDGNNAGEIQLQKFDFTGASAAPVRLAARANNGATTPPAPGIGGGLSNPVYVWSGANPAFKPTLAVDANRPSFTDTNSAGQSYTQVDNYVGNVYVAWGTNNNTANVPGNVNPNVIELTGSADGGNTFAPPAMANGSGNGTGNFGPARDSSPQIVISQGRPADPAVAGGAVVPGGQVSVIWDDSGSGRQPGASPPVDLIQANRVQDGAVAADFISNTFTPASGVIAQGATTSFPLNVSITDPNFVVSNLNAVVNVAHGSLNKIAIDLVSPAGTIIRLLNNKTNADGSTNNTGIAGTNLGQSASGNYVGTTFDSTAVQAISQFGAPAAAHFRPDGGSLLDFAGLAGNSTFISGTWSLRITDLSARQNPPPAQNLISFALNFTSGLNPGSEVTAATTTVQGAVANNAYPLLAPAAPDQGIGPNAVIASDNTLGAYSPHEGRIYVAYVSRSLAKANPADNTDIGLAYSDNGGTSWQRPGAANPLNDDNPTVDGFSEGDRPQFQPALAVDQATGTVVVSYLDARNDAARARVATYVGASIDGGNTFGPQAFVNPADQAQDAIKVAGGEANAEIVRGPLPDNQSAGNPLRDTTFGFGTHQAVAAFDGRVYPVWASNQNGGFDGQKLLNIHTARAVIAAGPRVVSSTEGPIGRSADGLNGQRAADGTPELTTIRVVFDRPINAGTFTPADFHLFYRDTNAGDAPVPITVLGIAPVVTPNDPSNDGHYGYTTFDVTISPQTGLGTYSYEVGPAPRTSIPALVIGSGLQSTARFLSPDTPLPVPGTPGGGGTGTSSDVTTSTITVGGHGATTIRNLAVNVDINYPNVGDLVLTLRAFGADGVTRKAPDIILYNAGGSEIFAAGANFSGTTFDDRAALPIQFGNAPYDGSFRPERPLGVLDGALLDGVYQLLVTDTQTGKTGVLADWSLTATSTAPAVPALQLGAPMDQNANAITGEDPGDVYAVPTPTFGLNAGGGAPTGPFSQDSLPILIPGPSVVATLAHHADGSAPTPAGRPVADAGVDGMIVRFDRDMDVNALPASAVTRVMGPAGLIPGPFTIVPDPGGDPNAPDAANHPRTFLIRFPAGRTQVLSGTYTVTFGPGLRDVHGNALDENQNAGLYLLDPSRNPNGQTVQVTYNAPISAASPAVIPAATVNPATRVVTPGKATASVVVTDTTPIQGVTVQLNINYPYDPDLTATLTAPNGTTITLFSGVGQGSTNNHANFFNTIFSDKTSPLTPIRNGGAPFFGAFNPQKALATIASPNQPFNPAGTWTLTIFNNGTVSPGDAATGTLTNFTLNLTKPVPNSGLGEPVADLASESFRIFALNPTNALASSVWTAVGPASIGGSGGDGPEGGGSGGRSGRIGGIAIDPSDPSGNTVYIGGASGGIWKTTSFLAGGGPTWIPLTDFGPTFAINIGGIAVFPRNNDPNQSIVFAATGEGDTGSNGVGVLRSMDGGATWTLLDSTNNNLPFNAAAGRPGRDHAFNGTSAFKIVVDPRLTPDNNVVVYMALSGGNGGIWRSTDSGQTWGVVQAGGQRTANLPGQATDLVLDPASATGGGGNLQNVYGALRGQGVYASTNEGQTFSQVLGNVGDPLIQDKKDDNGPVPVVPAPGTEPTPNGAYGRIALAKPFLTGNAAEDLNYQGWLFAGVIDGSSHFQGLYVTKDFGQNWTKVGIPNLAPVVTNGVAAVRAAPNNNPLNPDYDLGGGPAGTGLPAQGNYDYSFAIDPTNPNVLYMGGTADGQPTGFIRIDVTGIKDPHALVPYNNQGPDGGLLQNATNANTGPAAPPITLKDPTKPVTPQPYFNFFRDPNDPFGAAATLNVGNVTQFNNIGAVARWVPFDLGGTDQHRIVTFVDPLTGHARLIIGDDQGVFTGVDNNGTVDFGIGTADSPVGSRNGNLQITQFYYGAVQPSTNVTLNQVRQDQGQPFLFVGSAQDNGGPASAGGVLSPGSPDYGNITWGGPGGDATGVATDQQGDSTLYQYWWPCCGGEGTNFFQVNGTGRTLGLLQQALPGPTPDPQWPQTGGSNFALNPLSGQQVVITSQAGHIFLTENQGLTWSQIGTTSTTGGPSGAYAPAEAFGAPDPNSPAGIGNLDNFIYVGTGDGNILVTRTAGGGAAGNGFVNTTPGGLGTGPVQAIVTDPTRGSHRAYAVTNQGIYFNPNSVPTPALNGRPAVPAAPWTSINGNIFQLTQNPFGDPALSSPILRGLTSIAADWRYAIPDDPTAANSPTHPILYAGGQGGVFRSLDNGRTWAPFPQGATIPTTAAGAGLPAVTTPTMGYLPVTDITDLQTALGAINPTTGRPQARLGDPNVLTASTYGNGFYSIRLAPVVFPNTSAQPSLLTFGVQNVSTGRVTPVPSGAIIASTKLVVSGFSEQTAFGNVVTVNLLDETPGGATFGQVVGFAQTDATGHFTVNLTNPAFGAAGNGSANGDGPKLLGVQAVDASGTAGNIVTFAFILQRTPPSTLPPPVLDPGSDTGITGETRFARFTNVNAPTFDVAQSLAGPATVQLLRKAHDAARPNDTNPADYTVVATATGGATNGTPITVRDPGPVAEGTYDYAVLQFDAAGNQAPGISTPALAVTIDTVAPPRASAPALQAASNTGPPGSNKTNVNQPTLVGTLPADPSAPPIEPLPSVQIIRQTSLGTYAVLGSAQVSAQPDGSYAYAVRLAQPLPDGTYTLLARSQDVAGNLGAISTGGAAGTGGVTVTIITTKPPAATLALDPVEVQTGQATPPPANPSPQNPQVTRVARPMFFGNAGSGLTVDLVQLRSPLPVPGNLTDPANFIVLQGNVPVQNNGQALAPYSAMPAAPLAQGVYTLYIRTRDLVGNTSLSNPLYLQIKTQGPAVAPTLALAPASDTGLKGDNVTSIRRPVFTGHAEPFGQVDLVNLASPGGPVQASTVADGAGNFAVALPADLSNGRVVLGAREHDVVNNPGPLSAALVLSIVTTAGDYFGTHNADLAVFGQNNAVFNIVGPGGLAISQQFGAAQLDVPVGGDFNGDGRDDLVTYRPSNRANTAPAWSLAYSGGGAQVVLFGTPNSIPVPGSYDGAGKDDLATYDPANGHWSIFSFNYGVRYDVSFNFEPGDIPVPGSYLGDGKTDLAVYRPALGQLVVLNTGARPGTSPLVTYTIPGARAGDVPLKGDFFGDGRDDPAVYRPSDGTWIILRTANMGVDTLRGFSGGGPDVVPVPLDFNGDGFTDVASYRRPVGSGVVGTWTILDYGGRGSFRTQQFIGSDWDLAIDAPESLRTPRAPSLAPPRGVRTAAVAATPLTLGAAPNFGRQSQRLGAAGKSAAPAGTGAGAVPHAAILQAAPAPTTAPARPRTARS